MVEMGSVSGRAIAVGAMVVGLVGCGGNVDVAATGTGTGGGSGTSSASNGGGSASSSSGGGGAGGLPAPVCSKGEAAIVAARGTTGVVAFNLEGTWSEKTMPIAAADRITTFEDSDYVLGVFWIETTTDSSQGHFTRTFDGTGFEINDVHGWYPLSSYPLVTVGTSLLLGFTSEGSTLGRLGFSPLDWHPYFAPAPILVSAAVQQQWNTEVLALGLGPQNQLCDLTLATTPGGAWSAPHCRDEVHVFLGNDFAVEPPRAVVLPSGDVVVAYHESYATIAVTRRHEGVWSAPESLTPGGQSLDVALTATRGGKEVIVGIPGTSGLVSAARYVPDVGWGAPFPIEQLSAPVAAISAAPGICGDDAMIAYAQSSLEADVRVARVRGAAVEATTVASFTEKIPRQISISSRESVYW